MRTFLALIHRCTNDSVFLPHLPTVLHVVATQIPIKRNVTNSSNSLLCQGSVRNNFVYSKQGTFGNRNYFVIENLQQVLNHQYDVIQHKLRGLSVLSPNPTISHKEKQFGGPSGISWASALVLTSVT